MHFFNDIISMKKFDPNHIKIDEKSYKNILIYYIRYVMIKDSKFVKINSVNPLKQNNLKKLRKVFNASS